MLLQLSAPGQNEIVVVLAELKIATLRKQASLHGSEESERRRNKSRLGDVSFCLDSSQPWISAAAIINVLILMNYFNI